MGGGEGESAVHPADLDSLGIGRKKGMGGLDRRPGPLCDDVRFGTHLVSAQLDLTVAHISLQTRRYGTPFTCFHHELNQPSPSLFSRTQADQEGDHAGLKF
jgi:hypothetical protein